MTRQKIVECELPNRSRRRYLISLGERWSEKDYIAEAARRLVKEKLIPVEELYGVKFHTRDASGECWHSF